MVSERTQRYNNRRRVPNTRRRNGERVIRILLSEGGRLPWMGASVTYPEAIGKSTGVSAERIKSE